MPGIAEFVLAELLPETDHDGMRFVLLSGALTIAACFLVGIPARGQSFTFDLELKSGTTVKAVKRPPNTATNKIQAREVLKVSKSRPIVVTWTVTSRARTGTATDVLVHFFVVREEKAGQLPVPKLDKDVVIESALTMDFKPGEKSNGSLTFGIKIPGTYLLRLEALGSAAGMDGKDSFAALDLVVQ
jgi:hypothetical protein